MEISTQPTVTTPTIVRLKEITIRLMNLQIDTADLPSGAHLFDECGLDSTSIVELVLEVEQSFGVALVDDGLDADVLQTIQSLANFIDLRISSMSVE